MKFKIFILFLALLFTAKATTAQEINFTVKVNTTGFSNTGGNNYQLIGTVLDDNGTWSASNVAAGDSLFYIEESIVYAFIINSRTNSGNIVTAQITSVGTLLSTSPSQTVGGQVAIARKNANGYCAVPSGLQQPLTWALENRFKAKIATDISNAADVYSYLGTTGVLPLTNPPAIAQYLARNTANELYSWNGSAWVAVGGSTADTTRKAYQYSTMKWTDSTALHSDGKVFKDTLIGGRNILLNSYPTMDASPSIVDGNLFSSYNPATGGHVKVRADSLKGYIGGATDSSRYKLLTSTIFDANYDKNNDPFLNRTQLRNVLYKLKSNGTSNTKITFIGDSNFQDTLRMIKPLFEQLNNLGFTANVGYISFHYNAGSSNNIIGVTRTFSNNTFWTYKEAVTPGRGADGSELASLQIGATATIQTTSDLYATSTGFKLFYLKQPSGGNFDIYVDGVLNQNVATANGTTALGQILITGLANKTHSVTVTTTSATVSVFGIELISGKNIVLNNFSRGSTTSTHWKTVYANSTARAMLDSINSDLYMVKLGTNDQVLTSLATYASNMSEIIDTLAKRGEISTIGIHAIGDTSNHVAYDSVQIVQANAKNYPHISMLKYYGGSYQYMYAKGILISDLVHFSPLGGSNNASLITNFLGLSAQKSPDWSTLGTSGINPITNFLGTIDNFSLRFRTNNIERMIIDSTGRIGIGKAPTALLDVNKDAKINGITIGRSSGDISSNTTIGNLALASNTTGSTNVAIGFNSLFSNTTGTNNTAIGMTPLYYNTTGNNNIAIGGNALSANTTGSSNTAIGSSTLTANTTSGNNTAIGGTALSANVTGSSNTAIGVISLGANTTGAANTAVGVGALGANTTANNNTAIGQGALTANTTGTGNTSIGQGSLGGNITASNNTAIGQASLAANTAGNNTAIGRSALALNTTGTGNTSIGYSAAFGNKTGSANIMIGAQAGNTIQTGSNNTILYNGSGIFNYTTDSSLNNTLILAAGSNIRIYSDSTTRVGIGTTVPTNKLTVDASSTGNPIRLQGIQTGATTDSIATIQAGGVVRRFGSFNQITAGDDAASSVSATILAGQSLSATPFTRTITGATVGDFVDISIDSDDNDRTGIVVSAWVSAPNTVSYQIENKRVSSIVYTNKILRLRIRK